LLEVKDIRAAYGATPVLHGVSLRAGASSFLGLVGRNGVGKTTTLRSIVGLMPLTAGAVLFDGASLVGRATHDIARLGVAYVPENRGVFPSLTVMESLTLGARPRPAGRWSACSRSSRAWASAGATAAMRCPAASSRCWPSAGRC
jgi:branched-chain amino acid transport system ATP-binding protein